MTFEIQRAANGIVYLTRDDEEEHFLQVTREVGTHLGRALTQVSQGSFRKATVSTDEADPMKTPQTHVEM
jgi:predicted translin family RNA/ssDNA-binding protein